MLQWVTRVTPFAVNKRTRSPTRNTSLVTSCVTARSVPSSSRTVISTPLRTPSWLSATVPNAAPASAPPTAARVDPFRRQSCCPQRRLPRRRRPCRLRWVFRHLPESCPGVLTQLFPYARFAPFAPVAPYIHRLKCSACSPVIQPQQQVMQRVQCDSSGLLFSYCAPKNDNRLGQKIIAWRAHFSGDPPCCAASRFSR